jgi:hypothetical protein
MYDPSTDRLLELLNGPVEDEVRTCDKAAVTTNAFRRELRVCDRLLEEVSGVGLLSHSSGCMTSEVNEDPSLWYVWYVEHG